jgi:hypothetical protein
MLGIESQQKLTAFFQKIAAQELQVETHRQKLGRVCDFEPYSAFCRINRSGSKLICAQELNAFLR